MPSTGRMSSQHIQLRSSQHEHWSGFREQGLLKLAHKKLIPQAVLNRIKVRADGPICHRDTQAVPFGLSLSFTSGLFTGVCPLLWKKTNWPTYGPQSKSVIQWPLGSIESHSARHLQLLRDRTLGLSSDGKQRSAFFFFFLVYLSIL